MMALRTKTGVFWKLLVLFLCCSLGTCELKQPKSTTANYFQTNNPLQDDINKPQTFPDEDKGNLPVFSLDYGRIQVPFEFTLWVLLASFAKIGFHVYEKITIWIPESCLLIGIGLIVGAIMHSVKEEPPAVLQSNVFFLFMLPPIILNSGYFMPTRPFFENIGTVLWYSVVGTLWNSIGIGFSLFAICQFEVFGVQDINLQENLLFASIISAVDPVAALNVFGDVGVNEQVYVVIFGEGLFNDAVNVVLYRKFAFLADMPVVQSKDVLLGVARFFVVGIGGVIFGLLFGFVAAFTSRFTNKVREIEPLFVFMYSYLAYLVAELFAISSVLAIVTCALFMKYYVEENVAQRSCTTIRHVIKMLATVSETLIFFFLGVVTITTDHEWNWAYILFTLLFAFMWRGLGILVLTQIINPFRTIQFNLKDQFGLAYSGLRGAICFALVFTLPETTNRRKLFVTASIATIIFTVFVQGISIRPIVEFINIRRTNKDLNTINVEIHTRTMEHIICGVEDLCGQWGQYFWKDKFKRFNDRILKRILLRHNRDESNIVSLYKKLELQTAMELLDTQMGDISAAPSVVSLHDEKMEASRPKKTFKIADIKKMHDILSKNMYKIRHRTLAFTSKYNLPDNSQEREIVIRRHASVRRSFRSESFRDQAGQSLAKSHKYHSLQPGRNLDSAFGLRRRSHVDRLQSSGVSPRPSSRSFVPLRRLNTIDEPQSPRAASEHPDGLSLVGEEVSPLSLQGRKAPVPTPRRHSSHRAEEEELDVFSEEREHPPRGWVPENRDLREPDDPLLRHSSQRSQSSQR